MMLDFRRRPDVCAVEGVVCAPSQPMCKSVPDRLFRPAAGRKGQYTFKTKTYTLNPKPLLKPKPVKRPKNRQAPATHSRFRTPRGARAFIRACKV